MQVNTSQKMVLTPVHRLYRMIVLLALLALLADAGFSLDPGTEITNYVHHKWGLKDGLPQLSVESVIQTGDRYIWLGTQDGLVRFDGVHFTVFQKQNIPQLLKNFINTIYEDRGGNLWVGTHSGGLTRIINGQFTSFSMQNGLSSDVVNDIFEDRDGNLWVATDNGINLWKRGSDSFGLFLTQQGLTDNTVNTIAQTPDGIVWAGTAKGISCFRDGVFAPFPMNSDTLDDPLPAVNSLYPDRDGNLWIGTASHGLFRSGGIGDPEVTPYLTHNRRINVIYEDRDRNLWVGTDGGGLNRLNGSRLSVFNTSSGLAGNNVRSITEDVEGLLWIGTFSGGLSCLQDPVFTPLDTENGPLYDLIFPIFEDRSGKLWLGSYGNGLYCILPGSVTQFTGLHGLTDNRVTSIGQDHYGNIWIGTIDSGLNRLENGRFTNFTTKNGLSKNHITVIYVDSVNHLWAGTDGGGLNKAHLTPGKTIFEQYNTAQGLGSDRVRVIHESSDGRIWIGTDGGLSVINPEENERRFATYTTQHGLPGNQIWSIHQDSDGVFWIGTMESGLTRFKDGKFKTIYADNGILNNSILCILEDDNRNLWLSSFRGIVKVGLNQLNRFCDGITNSVQSRLFNETDGMISRECNGGFQPAGWKGKNGHLFFPTAKGVVTIQPDKIKHNPKPPVRIERMIVDSRTIQRQIIQPVTLRSLSTAPVIQGERIILEPGKEHFEFRYTGLSFAAPDGVRYKFKLEGFDKEWRDVGQRRAAYYTKLPPGHYTFRVIACNRNNEWNNTGASLSFYLKPFFYQTFWFYLLCIFFCFRHRDSRIQDSGSSS